jgi:TonB family protein
VFTDLARKASTLINRPVLAGWLFVSTRYVAAKLVRQERRRQTREQEAFNMNDGLENNEAACDWARVRPVLDNALSELSEADREAILLRFFEGRPFAEVGEQLRLTENTARMRVERALDKLRLRLMRSGVSSTTAVLAVALANQGVVAAPAGLSAIVSGTALATAGAGATAGVVMTFMSMSKLQLGILGAVAATGTTGFVLQSQANSALTQEIAALRDENRTATSAAVLPAAANNQSPADGFDEQKSRAYDAELTRLAAETAALQKQNAANDAKARAAAAGSAKTADLAKLDRLPRPTLRVVPDYPKELREAGVTGEVLVEFVVDATGAVKGAAPVRSTDRGFEAAAVAAVEKWEFGAGVKGGRPVNTRMQQVISFSLKPGEAKGGAHVLSTEAAGDTTLPTSTWF